MTLSMVHAFTSLQTYSQSDNLDSFETSNCTPPARLVVCGGSMSQTWRESGLESSFSFYKGLFRISVSIGFRGNVLDEFTPGGTDQIPALTNAAPFSGCALFRQHFTQWQGHRVRLLPSRCAAFLVCKSHRRCWCRHTFKENENSGARA